MLSPESLLRQKIPQWPFPAGYLPKSQSQRQPPVHTWKSRLYVYPWRETSWDALLEPLLFDLRGHRYQTTSVNCNPPDDYSIVPPYSRGILHLANRESGRFFVYGTPPLEAKIFRTDIENCISVSFEMGGPSTGPPEWLAYGEMPVNQWHNQRKCLCLEFFFAPGIITPSEWTEKIPIPSSQPDTLLPEIIKCCKDRCTRFAALSDGTSTILLHLIPPTDMYPDRAYMVCVYTVVDEPVQLCLALLIYKDAFGSNLWGMYPVPYDGRCRGALNSPSTLPSLDTVLKRRTLSEFDLYTMQRDKRYWEQFIVWKAANIVMAEARPHRPGDVLYGEKNSFIRNFILTRSHIPFPEIPKETSARIFSYTRPRDPVAFCLTTGSGTFSFRTSATLRAGSDTYSHVLCGVLLGDGVESGRLCLKLYDERLFPTPCYDRSDHDPLFWSPNEMEMDHLLTWNVAEDLARREEAAYDRLKDFQGSLLPYAYGVHHVTLPDGHRCIGLLMEYVEGMSLGMLDTNTIPEDKWKELAITVRHCLRVLRYAQIEQTDWHTNQFILRASRSNPHEFDVVLVDFAFALQHPDITCTRPTRDWIDCRNTLAQVLGFDLVESVWFKADENEF